MAHFSEDPQTVAKGATLVRPSQHEPLTRGAQTAERIARSAIYEYAVWKRVWSAVARYRFQAASLLAFVKNRSELPQGRKP